MVISRSFSPVLGIIITLLLSGGLYVFLQSEIARFETEMTHLSAVSPKKPHVRVPVSVPPPAPLGELFLPPPPPDMNLMKTKGCVADGLLNGYGKDEKESIAMINRSKCYYLHRALETWLDPPDFKKAKKIKDKITRPNTVYGMFVAEAISTKSEYWYPAEEREFDFRKMCRPGTKNVWGEHTCRPSLSREEYRRYVQTIAEQAMDLGVQVFLFGQVFYQDSSDPNETWMPEVIEGMREYASYRGMNIVIGAQTNDIADDRYLKLFDFVEGGIGINTDGHIDSGPCDTRWWKKPGDWCWALLWHPTFSNRANNVFLHLDWSARPTDDDMAIFTRMSKNDRRDLLERYHRSFTGDGFGFLLPLLARLNGENGGCHGPSKGFYSASKKYSCQDEEAVNRILSGK